MNIYEIKQEYLKLFQEVDEETGEIDEKKLIAIQANFEEAALNRAAWIKNLELQAESMGHALDNLKERKNKLEKKIKRQRDILLNNMQDFGRNEIAGICFDIKLKMNRASTTIFDESLLEEKYFRERISRAPNLEMIKKDIENGIDVPGAVIENKLSLQIK